ncbi:MULTISPECIES: hypothetical protein [Bacillus]|uniref:hypothetical protein n=1 Tax=Bacillus TaxID=1386 RepID=UPI0005970346|nr:hypothetical protein [Bacillus safensis]APT51540.1 hypothetical protein BSA41_17050 [Bacillus safensis]APT52187.1 hypothetical protein BSA171_00660 [Bacillus safensis]CUB19306.1 hypothetical protein BN2127_JRS3_01851 [Bacillus safensis]
MTNTCPYCGTKLNIETDFFFCDFCDMNLPLDQIQKDGERIQIINREINSAYLNMTTPELMTFSTWELILLLKEARKTRAFFFEPNTRKNTQKGEDEQFKLSTKKMYVIENILKIRLGYIPANLNQSFLNRYNKNIENPKYKTKMLIWET